MDIITTLKKEKQDLEKRINAINNVLSIYEEGITSVVTPDNVAMSPADPSKEPDFPTDGTWLEQIVYVIKSRNRFVHNNEIAEVLIPYYPKKGIKEIKRRISSVLSQAKRQGVVPGLVNYQFSKSKQDTVWGKDEWLDEQGKIKEDYKFKITEKNQPQNQIGF